MLYSIVPLVKYMLHCSLSNPFGCIVSSVHVVHPHMYVRMIQLC